MRPRCQAAQRGRSGRDWGAPRHEHDRYHACILAANASKVALGREPMPSVRAGRPASRQTSLRKVGQVRSVQVPARRYTGLVSKQITEPEQFVVGMETRLRSGFHGMPSIPPRLATCQDKVQIHNLIRLQGNGPALLLSQAILSLLWKSVDVVRCWAKFQSCVVLLVLSRRDSNSKVSFHRHKTLLVLSSSVSTQVPRCDVGCLVPLFQRPTSAVDNPTLLHAPTFCCPSYHRSPLGSRGGQDVLRSLRLLVAVGV